MLHILKNIIIYEYLEPVMTEYCILLTCCYLANFVLNKGLLVNRLSS